MLVQKSINNLSSEILLKIFEYSRDRDLRNLRLVNSKWNQVCQVYILNKSCTLFLSDEAIIKEIAYIMRSNQMFTNVVLTNMESQLQLEDYPPAIGISKLWIKLGRNIENLSIYSGHKIFNHNWFIALKHSRDLQKLCINISPENVSHNRKSLEGIDELRREISKYYFPSCKFNILRQIELEIFDDRVTTEYLKFFNKTVTIRNLASLKICSRFFGYCSTKCSLANELENLIRSNAGTLKILKVIGFNPTVLSSLTDIANLSLDLFEWDSCEINLPELTVDFLLAQDNIRKLFFTICHSEEILALEHLKNLEYLFIVIRPDGNFNEIDLPLKIINNFPKLKYFKLSVYSEKGGALCKASYSPDIMMNTHLESLSLKLNETENTESITLLLQNIDKLFPGLRNLTMDIPLVGLPLVCEKLKDLEELDLNIYEADGDMERFLTSSNHANQHDFNFKLFALIKNLKTLRLDCPSRLLQDDVLIQNFQLSRLKTLSLFNCGDHTTDQGILGLINNCPALKTLELQNFRNISSDCVELIQKRMKRFDMIQTMNNYSS